MLYVGFEREQWHFLRSLPAFSHFPHYPQANWALLVLIPGWVGLCTFKDPVGLSNELSCEAWSFSHCHFNPHRCFQSESLRLYFPELEPWVSRSVLLPVVPPGLSPRKCGTALSTSFHHTRPGPPAATLPRVLSAWLPVFTPPAGLDECFFFNSLVVGLPYS